MPENTTGPDLPPNPPVDPGGLGALAARSGIRALRASGVKVGLQYGFCGCDSDWDGIFWMKKPR